jgi:hypothetical protein
MVYCLWNESCLRTNVTSYFPVNWLPKLTIMVKFWQKKTSVPVRAHWLPVVRSARMQILTI